MNMRRQYLKRISVVILSAMIIWGMLSDTAQGKVMKKQTDFEYKVTKSGVVTITKIKNPQKCTVAVIPREINGDYVWYIKDGLFKKCKNLKTVVISSQIYFKDKHTYVAENKKIDILGPSISDFSVYGKKRGWNVRHYAAIVGSKSKIDKKKSTVTYSWKGCEENGNDGYYIQKLNPKTKKYSTIKKVKVKPPTHEQNGWKYASYKVSMKIKKNTSMTVRVVPYYRMAGNYSTISTSGYYPYKVRYKK